jgi:hypothetical protein
VAAHHPRRSHSPRSLALPPQIRTLALFPRARPLFPARIVLAFRSHENSQRSRPCFQESFQEFARALVVPVLVFRSHENSQRSRPCFQESFQEFARAPVAPVLVFRSRGASSTPSDSPTATGHRRSGTSLIRGGRAVRNVGNGRAPLERRGNCHGGRGRRAGRISIARGAGRLPPHPKPTPPDPTSGVRHGTRHHPSTAPKR